MKSYETKYEASCIYYIHKNVNQLGDTHVRYILSITFWQSTLIEGDLKTPKLTNP